MLWFSKKKLILRFYTVLNEKFKYSQVPMNNHTLKYEIFKYTHTGGYLHNLYNIYSICPL